MPYPLIDGNGELVADENWWQQMQLSRSAWQAMESQHDDEESDD